MLQATLQHGMLFMAGQLGLDPPTMTLISGGVVLEAKQAISNCEAVAGAFSASLCQSSISLIVYCSSSVDLAEAELVLLKALGQHNLPTLFVYVAALPKG
jgi:diphthine-ammonia ligase